MFLTPEGLIDCPRCPVRTAPTERREINLHTGEYREIDEQHLEVLDCLREDAQRGKGQGAGKGGSRGTKGRSKPIKFQRGRYEQDPVFNGRAGGSIVVTSKAERIHAADKRMNLYIPAEFKAELEVEAERRTRTDSTKWPVSRLLRSSLRCARYVTEVTPFPYGAAERACLQLKVYPDELTLLDTACSVRNCSRGEFLAACYAKFKEMNPDE